jgi:hypothetical protein
MASDSRTERAYVRELPGGGFVAIDVIAVESSFYRRQYHATLVVERRTSDRREGHLPPEIARASGHSVESVLHQLLPMAQSNPAIGAGLLALRPVTARRFRASRPASATRLEHHRMA